MTVGYYKQKLIEEQTELPDRVPASAHVSLRRTRQDLMLVRQRTRNAMRQSRIDIASGFALGASLTGIAWLFWVVFA